jgi:hypothetical protein
MQLKLKCPTETPRSRWGHQIKSNVMQKEQHGRKPCKCSFGNTRRFLATTRDQIVGMLKEEKCTNETQGLNF